MGKGVYVAAGYLLFLGLLGIAVVISYFKPPQIYNPLLVMGFTLTAFSILFGFFITILGNPRIQIGRKPALFIWAATFMLLFSVFGNYAAAFYGVDELLASTFSTSLVVVLIVLAVVLMVWGVVGAYQEEKRRGKKHGKRKRK